MKVLTTTRKVQKIVERTVLSERGVEVLGMVARGDNSEIIARHFGTSAQVIKNDIKAMLNFSGTDNRPALIDWAYRTGILRCDDCPKRK